MSGSKARFTLAEAIAEYCQKGSDAAQGCDVLASGGALNVNIPSERRLLQAALKFGFPAIIAGIMRDGHLTR